jgi:hypothetical protein
MSKQSRVRSPFFGWTALAFALVALPVAAACGLSGHEGRVYSAPVSSSADPDTLALPAATHGKMNDPLAPPAPAETAAAAPADAGAVAVAETDAGKPGPAKPTTTTTAKPAVAAAPAADCGTKENPCPMQRFMRGSMASASTPEALAGAFARAAGMSPSGGWSWRAIAQKGADAAKAGDVPGAKAQCKACHDAYKESYKAQYRARKI